MMKLRVIKLFFAVCMMGVTLLSAQVLKVGAYDNRPKIFFDETGNVQGFFPELTQAIAEDNGWELFYVPCEWSQCLELLKRGEIDIMPDVAYLKERTQKFHFSNETVFSSWSVLYRRKDGAIDTVLDLKDKRIAVLQNSVQHRALENLIKDFDLQNVTLVTIKDFAEGFEMLRQKEVHALSVNRFYQCNCNSQDYIEKTGILIQPTMVRYGIAPQRNDLIAKIDRSLQKFKNDTHSVYYDAMDRWLSTPLQYQTPSWVMKTVMGMLGVIVLLVVVVLVFRSVLRQKTRELTEKDQLIQIQSKNAAMGQMISLIAHQWKQPLNIISMSVANMRMSQELHESIEPQELQNHLSLLEKQVQQMGETIEDFRNFFIPDRKKSATKVSKLLERLNKMIAMKFKQHSITYHEEIIQDFTLSVYPNEILHVLINIITNATDALIHNAVKVPQVRLRCYEDEEHYVIEICDNAGGIPKEVMKQISTQYFSTKEEQGTGLGLYMSRLILEKHHNARLHWENKNGGACFALLFPKDES